MLGKYSRQIAQRRFSAPWISVFVLSAVICNTGFARACLSLSDPSHPVTTTLGMPSSPPILKARRSI